MRNLYYTLLVGWALFLPLQSAWGGEREEVEKLFESSLQNDDLETNKAILQKIIDLAPESDYGHFSKGWFLAQEENYKMAVSEYQAALSLRPQFGEARNNLASAYFHLGRWSESIEEYQEVLREHPEWGETHLNLGSVYYMAKRHFASVHEWETALQMNPDLFIVHYYLGLALDKLGRLSAARTHYQQFLTAEKDEAEFSEYIEHASERQSEIWVQEGRERT